ncbi:MAG: hypothetical protein K6D91_04610 [Prevotella sp.]|nr:hypothetical protein [Prevotella sp.]
MINKVLRSWMTAMACVVVMGVLAQDEINTVAKADILSQYMWRGQEMGATSFQPALGIEWKGFSLVGGANIGISDKTDPKELDITAQYSLGHFRFGLVDYWSDSPNTRYLYYNAHTTSHVFEGFVGYDFGLFDASWQTNFAGQDYQESDGKRAFSSYVELTAPFKLATCKWEAQLAFVPWKSDYYHTTGFAVTNVNLKAIKEIRLTEHFVLPVFAQVVANPCSQKTYIVFGLTIE